MDPNGLFKLFISLLFLHFLAFQATATTHQTYIIQLDPDHFSAETSSFSTKPEWHASFLQQSLLSNDNEEEDSRILYSYEAAMEGFSARLSKPELAKLQSLPGVLSIRPDSKFQTQTTYSYKFMGLNPTTSTIHENPWLQKAHFGRGTIIGFLDTGVWPESPSFHDQEMPPPPPTWRGACQPGMSCNNKLVGAKYFMKGHSAGSGGPGNEPEYESARDSHGHGTHTASTAAGASVGPAGVLGNALGVARGVAPMAHVAVYKVCWSTGCYGSDIMAAMDEAISDGVDVLSLSLGGFPTPMFADTIAIGSFRAVERGVAVVCAAGNNGPAESTVANEAPWILTVGAGTMDRKFPAVVRLANGERLYGESMYPGNRKFRRSGEFELFYGSGEARFCLSGTLAREKVAGKMVVCDRGVNGRSEKGQVVKDLGGLAMVLTNTEINLEEDSVDVHVLPATQVGFDEAVKLKSYINSSSSSSRPRARIEFGGTVIAGSAPAVAEFSGRGPSFSNPSILKPDVIAPGVNIVAAWPLNLGPTGLPEDRRRSNFTVMSGTSMSCPHVSGAAALLRAAHRKWSPAAVKSALMTSALQTSRGSVHPIMDGEKPAGAFAMGSGHVSPAEALDPGLVYDISPNDYVAHLCTLGYSGEEVRAVTHKNVSCVEILRRRRGFSLNYPSISATFKGGRGRRKVFWRAVTNVGPAGSVYTARVEAPEGVRVRVKPRRLSFKKVGQVLRFKIFMVSMKKEKSRSRRHVEGHLTWVGSGSCGGGMGYRVRSPISVTWKNK